MLPTVVAVVPVELRSNSSAMEMTLTGGLIHMVSVVAFIGKHMLKRMMSHSHMVAMVLRLC